VFSVFRSSLRFWSFRVFGFSLHLTYNQNLNQNLNQTYKLKPDLKLENPRTLEPYVAYLNSPHVGIAGP
jgi:hypothetical protein